MANKNTAPRGYIVSEEARMRIRCALPSCSLEKLTACYNILFESEGTAEYDKNTGHLRITKPMNYLDLQDNVVVQAFAVADKLQDWIDENATSVKPVASLTVSGHTVELAIGDYCVWSTKANSIEELAFEHCVEAFFKQFMQWFDLFAADRQCTQSAE